MLSTPQGLRGSPLSPVDLRYPAASNGAPDTGKIGDPLLCIPSSGVSPSSTIPGSILPSSTAPSGVTESGAALLTGIVRRAFIELIGRLFVHAIPLPEMPAFARAAQALRTIHLGQASVPCKLRDCADVLQRLHTQLGGHALQASAASVRLREFLHAVLPWLRESATQWVHIEMMWEAAQSLESVSEQGIVLLDGALHMLTAAQSCLRVDSSAMQDGITSLRAARAMLTQCGRLSALPPGAGAHAYLSLLACDEGIADGLMHTLRPLADALRLACQLPPFDPHASWEKQIGWLVSITAQPGMRQVMSAHLDMILGDRAQVDLFFAVMQLARAMLHGPASTSVVEQARWMARAVRDSGALPALTGGMAGWLQGLTGHTEALSVLDGLLKAGSTSQTLSDLMPQLARLALPRVAPWVAQSAAYLAVAQVLPAEAGMEIERVYRDSHAGESWAGLFGRIAQSLYALASPAVLGQWLADPTAAATMRFARQLQTHTHWAQTLTWLMTYDTGADFILKGVHEHCALVLAVWRIHTCIALDNVEQAEAALADLARKLKDATFVQRMPFMARLIDLLPLLPALRRIHAQMPVAAPEATWWDRLAYWQCELTRLDTPESRALHARLTQQAVDWLADAGMSAGHALAARQWMPLAGAQAVPMATTSPAQRDERGRTDGGPNGGKDAAADATSDAMPSATPDAVSDALPHAIPDPMSDGSVRRYAGATVSMVGASALAYALYASRRRQGEYTLVHSNQGEAGPTASVLVGMLALATGGWLLYPEIRAWVSGHAAGSAAPCAPAVQASEDAVVRMIATMALPDLDCLFAPEVISGPAAESVSGPAPESLSGVVVEAVPEAVSQAAPKARPDAARSRAARAAALNEDDCFAGSELMSALERIATDPAIDAAARGELRAGIERFRHGPLVRSGPTPNERAARLLMQVMQAIIAVTRDEASQAPDGITHERLDTLWRLLYPLYESESRNAQYGHKVQKVGELYEIGPTLKWPETAERTAPDVEAGVTQKAMDAAAIQMVAAFDPVLDPATFIDGCIRRAIQAYDKTLGSPSGLTPASDVRVTFVPLQVGHMNMYAKSPPVVTRAFSLLEVATGQHHYHADVLDRAHAGARYRVQRTSHAALINALEARVLQTEMTESLSAYRNNDSHMAALERFTRAAIVTQCLAYLHRPNRIPLFASAVESFLAGQVQARELVFQGQVANGAICIPARRQMALILDLDGRDIYFHVYEREHHYYVDGERSKLVPMFPETARFEDWLYRKVPIRHALTHADRDAAFKDRHLNFMSRYGFGQTVYRDMIYRSALHYGEPIAMSSLPAHLRDLFLDRVADDIDMLIFSDQERHNLHLLDLLKAVVNLAGLGLAVAVPGTGTLLCLVCSFLAGSALQATGVAAAAVQARIADDPERVRQYSREALVGAILLGAGTAYGSARLGAGLMTRTFSVDTIRQVLGVYRGLRRAIERSSQPRLGTAGRLPLKGIVAADSARPASPGELAGKHRTASAPLKDDTGGTPSARAPSGSGAGAHHPAASRQFILACEAQGAPLSGVKPSLKGEGLYHYQRAPVFRGFGVRTSDGKESIGFRTLTPGRFYVQAYSRPLGKHTAPPSTTLVVSAHGGFIDSDMMLPAIALPSARALQMFCPHGAKLFDPTLDVVLNDPNFQAYVTFKDGLQAVSYLPQTHASWLFGPDFNPAHVLSTQGQHTGLWNYRHFQYEESPWEIIAALDRNRALSKAGQVARADILAMNDSVASVWETNPNHAGVKRVLDLDAEGLLVNAQGQRYDTIAFCHCRSNLLLPDRLVSTYLATNDAEQVVADFGRGKDVRLMAIYRTTLSRSSPDQAFDRRIALTHLYLYRMDAARGAGELERKHAREGGSTLWPPTASTGSTASTAMTSSTMPTTARAYNLMPHEAPVR